MATNLLRCGKWYKTTKSEMAAIASGAGETPKAKQSKQSSKAQEHEQRLQRKQKKQLQTRQPLHMNRKSDYVPGALVFMDVKLILITFAIHESANRRL